MAADVSITVETIQAGAIRTLDILTNLNRLYPYDVSADGQSFLVITPVEQKSPTTLTLVQNWTALLKKK